LKPSTNKGGRSWRKRILRAVVFALLFAATLMMFPQVFLRVSHEPAACDALVLLGGAPGERDQVTVDLYRRGFSQLIVVTGQGDCLDNARLLAARGVPTNALLVGCEARTTQENALEVSRLLRGRGVTNVTLVTSWYHSRRSLATFRRFAPELRARCVVSERHHALKAQLHRVGTEYLKTVAYALRWGVWPWSLPAEF
jgi:uncharacterized SAM-binding protein YcdF (DUF218 family)